MKLSESCACGGHISIEDVELERAVDLIRDWREMHECPPVENRRSGGVSSTTLSPGFTRIRAEV